MKEVGVGRSYVYVFPRRDEDMLKLGFSRDPLDRVQSLHPRYFEFFDLAKAFLIEVDTVREARSIELDQRHALREHNAPEPLSIERRAGGRTEWYRGALLPLRLHASALESQGHIVHLDLREWFRKRLLDRAGVLHHWALAMFEAIDQSPHGGQSPTSMEWRLRNALDTYPAFGLPFADFVPSQVSEWHAHNESRFAFANVCIPSFLSDGGA